MRIVVLAGGIGGARFLRGLRQAVPDAEVTVIGNTGDDIHLFGLKVCPDLDTVMYTLGDGIDHAIAVIGLDRACGAARHPRRRRHRFGAVAGTA